MTTKTYRVGLLGAGFISAHHAKPLNQLNNVKLEAICDIQPGAAEQIAASHNIPHVFDSLDKMLELKLDVIHILVPPDFHIDVARQIIDAGSNVFLEKPMGVSATECKELVAYASEKNLQVGVNHNFLFLPAYQKFREDFKSGKIGKLNHLTVNWFYPLGVLNHGPYHIWMVREPGNVMLELGSHLSSFALDIAGDPVGINVNASRPITLPTGITVPRRWQIHGDNADSTFDLNLSLQAGFTDRSLTVQGHGAVAHCDYERNIYRLDSYTTNTSIFHNFSSNMKLAGQNISQAFGNLFRNVTGTFLKTSQSNPFEQSMSGSINCFYKTLETELDDRLSGEFGARVIELCERSINRATLPESHSQGVPVEIKPPASDPDVLVLGGTGFIGRQLVKELTQRGQHVRVVTRSEYSGKIALNGLPVDLVQGSLKDPEFLDDALDGIKIVYHLAKAVGSNWNDYYENDVLVTKNIAERSLAANVQQFIYTGTIDSYYSGDPNETITGETPLDPKIKTRNFYAQSKAACEDLLMEMHQEKSLPLTIFRPGVVIGEGCSPYHWGVGMWWSDTMMQYWGNGESKLPLVLVEDVATGLANAIGNTKCLGKTYNLIDRPLLSAVEYIDACSEASGTQIQAVKTPTYKYFVNDALKSAAKFAIKHPNRAIPSYRDWKARSHCSVYDASDTIDDLDWKPASSREKMIEKGIVKPMAETLR